MSAVNDPTSAAQPYKCCVKHMDLDWLVSFEESKISGIVVFSAQCADEGSSELALDVRDLNIDCIWDNGSKEPLDYTCDRRDFEPFGSKLTIKFPKSTELKKIALSYSTTPNCSALQWLNAEQTTGKVHPYLFSQCQAIHARSLVPCQDSPGIKVTYSAQVSIKQPLAVVMSALPCGTPQDDPKHPGHVIYKFNQPVEDMLQGAEELLGRYVWGIYDILVLPPSFPFGGMENPCITFATPTILAGDRSLANVIVHEITHSWTGNLVTNATFEHFWLNEGHTVFVERKICSRNKGEAYRNFLAINGWKSLEYAAIHARSLVPCQDSPGIKVTYSAQVSIKQPLAVVMSALPCGTPQDDPKHPGHVIYKFNQPVEDMLQGAEELLGRYVWGIYDILVLPPSFPFGGMENPCITFATPTILAGDRSLANVIVHEITHSWTGNLVTNATFEHFWLNEGHTVFVERKICSRNKGEAYRNFLAINGWKSLEYAISKFGNDHPYTKLVVDLKAADPDDAFSTVPYEKGHSFLFYLEGLVGGPDEFNPFLRSFIDTFKYRTVTSEQYKQFFLNFFSELKTQGKLDCIDWETWLYKPGLPERPNFDDTLVRKCDAFVDRWITADESTLGGFSKNDLDGFLPLEVEHILTTLNQKVLNEVLESCLYMLLGTPVTNPKWIRVCLKARYDGILPLAFQFITDVGRMKFVRPIYIDLYAWENVRQQTIELFKKNRSTMHSTTAGLVAKELKLE